MKNLHQHIVFRHSFKNKHSQDEAQDCFGPPGINCWFSFAPEFQWFARHPRDFQVSVATRFCQVLISVSS